VLQIDDLNQTRAEQILLTSLPSLLRLHCESLRPTRVESRESQLQIRGNRQTEFACKPAATPHKLANPITSSRPINQPAQWLRNSSRPTSSWKRPHRCQCGPFCLIGPVLTQPARAGAFRGNT
jgi:hypothetical protein